MIDWNEPGRQPWLPPLPERTAVAQRVDALARRLLHCRCSVALADGAVVCPVKEWSLMIARLPEAGCEVRRPDVAFVLFVYFVVILARWNVAT